MEVAWAVSVALILLSLLIAGGLYRLTGIWIEPIWVFVGLHLVIIAVAMVLAWHDMRRNG